jgi:beta-galactosidase
MSSYICHLMSSSSRFFSVKTVLPAAIALSLASLPEALVRAQNPAAPIRIDASEPFHEPGPAFYDEGSAITPAGLSLGVNGRYLTLKGRPWLPVMGEFHFSRYPRAQWEDEILKMKAAGVDIVSTYVIWIHHEEIQGQFDWTGQRDLRAFAQLCAKHGMYMVARIGPWDHGEVRNGGLPDWVLKQGPTRVNDPVYLASVRALYGQIALQLKGLLWKDGGPVIGIQLENEYSKRGSGAGEAHILELKSIAIASGLDVPLYLVTGWDNAVVPPRAVVPVYGGYSDAPWDRSVARLPPAEVYAFRFQTRVAANANPGIAQGKPNTKQMLTERLPYLTAEIGGGIQDTYHRRPVIAPDDIAAMVPVMLGSGVNLYGTYMFQGGENPDGKLSTLQESQVTGYPNDVPIKSYDFQAPLGEFGEERASLRKLKVFQYFLNDFGSELAPMIVHSPDIVPANPADLSPSRVSVRSNGDTGFIFFNNYVRNDPTPVRKAAQFLIHLPHCTLTVPHRPVDLPSGAYFIWPFNLDLDGANLRYATAQLFTRIEQPGVTVLYFEAQPGISPEFAFDAATVRTVKSSAGEIVRDSGVVYVRGIQPGIDSSIDIVSNSGKSLRLIVFTAHEAENAWKVRIGDSEHLLITEQDFFADTDSRPARILLRSRGTRQFQFTVTPPITAPLKSTLPLASHAATKYADTFSARAPIWNFSVGVKSIQTEGIAAPVRIGPALAWRKEGVAQVPDVGELSQAAKWAITVPAGSLDGLSELFLCVDYEGDLARFTEDHRLLDDNFYNGKPWMIGLKQFLAPNKPGRFELSVLPLRKDAPVYFELRDLPQFGQEGQVGTLNQVRLVPEYQLELTPGGR